MDFFFAGEGIYGRGIVYPPSDKLILSVALTSCVSEVTEPTLKGWTLPMAWAHGPGWDWKDGELIFSFLVSVTILTPFFQVHGNCTANPIREGEQK